MKLVLFSIFVWINGVQSDRHSLLYLYSAFTKPDGGFVFSAVGLFDDRRISHYSNQQKTWKRDGLYSDIWREPDKSREQFLHEQTCKTLANCTHFWCDGLHTLQRRIGCEIDEVMNVDVFDEYGYDGEDFIYFNFTTMQWKEKNPKAKETKLEWNNDTHRNQYLKLYLNHCRNQISTFTAPVTSPPDVHLFASEAPHDRRELNLTCLATGFYPKHIKMKITLNDTLQPFISTGVRPNSDGSFQKRVSVRVNRDQTDGYECHVVHNSRTHTTSWDGNCTNCSKGSRSYIFAAAVACLFAVVVLIICSWRKSMMNCEASSSKSLDLFNEAVEHSLKSPLYSCKSSFYTTTTKALRLQ